MGKSDIQDDGTFVKLGDVTNDIMLDLRRRMVNYIADPETTDDEAEAALRMLMAIGDASKIRRH